jgi:hypothetical protein
MLPQARSLPGTQAGSDRSDIVTVSEEALAFSIGCVERGVAVTATIATHDAGAKHDKRTIEVISSGYLAKSLRR